MAEHAEPASPAREPLKLGRRGTFVPNVLSNFANFGLSILIGLWFTPYLIGHLGTAVYGLIPLAVTVTHYMGFLTLGVNTSVGRFLTIALEQDDEVASNRVFNTSFFTSLSLSAILIIPAAGLALFADKLVDVPPGYEIQARRLFGFIAATFILNTVMTPFGVSTFCRNRFDLRNLLFVIQNLGRVGLVFVAFSFFTPELWQVGLGVLAGSILSSIGIVFTWKYLTPILHLSWKSTHWQTLKEISGTSIWLILSHIGFILITGTELLLANRLLGADAAGRYAVVLQWAMLLRALNETVASVFAPTVFSLYAKKEFQGAANYTRQAIKMLGLIMALPIGGLCGLSKPLLTTWLGPEFADLSPLMVLMIWPLCINLAASPLANIYIAANKVRIPALVNVGLGITLFALAIVLTRFAGWGMYGIAAAAAITFAGRNLLFTPFYAAAIIRQNPFIFLREIILAGAVSAGVITVSWLISDNLAPEGWIQLIASGTAVTALYAPLVYFLILNAEDRKLLAAKVPPPLRKFLPLIEKEK